MKKIAFKETTDGVLLSGEILDRILAKTNSLKSLIYSTSFKKKGLLTKMCCETLRYKPVLDRVLLECPKLTTNCQQLEQSAGLVLVAVYEFLFAPMGLKSARWLVSAMERNRGDLLRGKQICIDEKLIDSEGKILKAEGEEEEPEVKLPRYARINRLVVTDLDDLMGQLTADGWSKLETPEQCKMKKLRELIAGLREDQFLTDPHVKDLLIFPIGTDLHAYRLVQDGSLILQDKASLLPVECLGVKPGNSVLETCAAPGMKTTHLAGLMNNKGVIHSFDRDRSRYEVMKKMMKSKGVTIAQISNQDFLRTDQYSDQFKKIRLALVDPPCTGSGIVNRKGIQSSEEDMKRRLRGLANLQAMLLKQALKLPNIDRVVYSTCSTHQEENEAVIQEILESNNKFEVVEAMPEWKHRGSKEYEFGPKCLRSTPKKDLANGFFVCVIQRKLVG